MKRLMSISYAGAVGKLLLWLGVDNFKIRIVSFVIDSIIIISFVYLELGCLYFHRRTRRNSHCLVATSYHHISPNIVAKQNNVSHLFFVFASIGDQL